ncbi:MAG: hypothetical protein HS100_01155 [Anaerolineales bacterium]|nr:hypothetical protein [Anaerolineales bacterium]MCE7858591.1 hypothetical protein [Chloroflexi bacterium CFX2]MCK6581851.1 hypothetical protein [Anaerolineales bacterium]
MVRRLFDGIGSFLQTPFGVLFVTVVVFHGVLFFLGVDYTNVAVLGVAGFILLVDIIATNFILDKLVYFFSQFVLPVQTPKDRQEIYARVSAFDGKRGPTLFVKNGRLITHAGETKKQGPGVIVLDTASAVVLQTETEIIGAAGPGIRFTRGKERITREEGVDLRAQWQFIGPLASDQPFLNPVPISDPKKYNELQARRQQTAGLTRDGFEISPTISIKFRIKRPEEKVASESGVVSQYGYNAQAVLNAVTREVIELVTAENRRSRMEWYRLPAHLVVNLWREYVRKFKLEDLFKADGISGLQTIEEMLNRRLKRPFVVALDDTGLPETTGEAIPSLEYEQLEARGLEIMDVRIHNVLFDPVIEEQTIKNWNAEWMKVAQRDADLLNEHEKLIETAAHSEAVKNFARLASQKFDNPISPPEDIFSTLQNLIEPVRETILIESRANNQMESEIKKLDEIWKWLLVNKLDASMHREEGGS